MKTADQNTLVVRLKIPANAQHQVVNGESSAPDPILTLPSASAKIFSRTPSKASKAECLRILHISADNELTEWTPIEDYCASAIDRNEVPDSAPAAEIGVSKRVDVEAFARRLVHDHQSLFDRLPEQQRVNVAIGCYYAAKRGRMIKRRRRHTSNSDGSDRNHGVRSSEPGSAKSEFPPPGGLHWRLIRIERKVEASRMTDSIINPDSVYAPCRPPSPPAPVRSTGSCLYLG